MGVIFTTELYAEHKTFGYQKVCAEHETSPIANALLWAGFYSTRRLLL
jgi:hypothetical protein